MSSLQENWQTYFFALLGMVFLGFCLDRLLNQDVAGGSTTFAMSFFCFFYSNIARFKRFKGLGFEAELWDEKQREADKIIESLRTIAVSSAREILSTKIRAGRWGASSGWQDTWRLYDELSLSLGEIADENALQDAAEDIEKFFAIDVVSGAFNAVVSSVIGGVNEREQPSDEFQSRDAEDRSRFLSSYHEIRREIQRNRPNLQSENPRDYIDLVKKFAAMKEEYTGEDVLFDQTAADALVNTIEQSRIGPVPRTPQNIAYANKDA